MKYLVAFLLILVHVVGFSQLNQNLVRYGQVWGFLKYHHAYPSQVDFEEEYIFLEMI